MTALNERAVMAAAKALYRSRFPSAPVEEHFDWYEKWKHDHASCVHRSTIADAVNDACTAIEAYHAHAHAHASEPDAVAVAVAAEREAIVQLLYKCPHDGGFDRELGPIGCSLDAQTEGGCVCAGLATAIRARSQP